jgi:hypothetical protein
MQIYLFFPYISSIYFKIKVMAKKETKSGSGSKITFGKNKVKGKAKKSFGPKSQKPKKYRGQGK